MHNLEELKKPLRRDQIIEINPVSLAFLGDSLHTVFVRNSIVKFTKLPIGKQHILAIKYCKANFQAKTFDSLSLNEDEQEIARRARNTKSHDAPKSSNLEEYKKATAYEALLGYQYLIGNYERLYELLNKTFIVGEKSDN